MGVLGDNGREVCNFFCDVDVPRAVLQEPSGRAVKQPSGFQLQCTLRGGGDLVIELVDPVPHFVDSEDFHRGQRGSDYLLGAGAGFLLDSEDEGDAADVEQSIRDDGVDDLVAECSPILMAWASRIAGGK